MNEITIDNLIADIPADVARRAHAFTSFTPDNRGDQERYDYACILAGDHATLLTLADTDEKRAALEEEFARYRVGFRKRYLAHLEAKGKTASPMITGPARFPVRRNHKALATEDRRAAELHEYRVSALRAIRKRLQPEKAPIALGDADAADRIRLKLEALEKQRDVMRAVNGVIRVAAKHGSERQIRALVDLGLTDEEARDVLKPDFAGRVGYPPYRLSNVGAEIRRLRQRLAAVERNQAAETVESEGTNGIRFEDCPAENRVRLFFPGKPEADVRSDLKSSRFRWSPRLGCWQAYRNHQAIQKAKRVAGVAS